MKIEMLNLIDLIKYFSKLVTLKGDFKLKRLVYSGLLICILILAGCNTSREKEEQKASAVMKDIETIAFKDDFTSKFMDSKKEIKAGYYRLKSMTEGYTMLFPVNAKMSKENFSLNSDAFETYSFTEEVKKENPVYDYKITYENRSITSNTDLNLALLSNNVGYEGTYEEFIHEEKTYYYANDTSKDGETTTYHYLSYIKSNQSDQAISYVMNSIDADHSGNEKLNPEKLEERFLLLIKSIDFLE
jgi:hypothetical protein